MHRPARRVAVQLAVTALISLMAIRLAGAPPAIVAIQAGTFLMATVIATRKAWAVLIAQTPPQWLIGAVLLSAVAVLLAPGYAGVHRWIRIGPVMLHPASVLGSIVLVALARARGHAMCLLLAAGTVLAFGRGPDAAASLAFALGATGLLFDDGASRRRCLPLCLLAWTLASWSALRSEAIPAVPYVEEVLARAWTVSRATGAAGALALAALPMPFLLAARDRERRSASLALAGFWTGLAAAGVAGNYPIPVIGYGASPVIGWILALFLVASPSAAPSSAKLRQAR